MRDALKKVIDLTMSDPSFADVLIKPAQADKMPTGMAVVLAEVRCTVKGGGGWNYLFVVFSQVAGSYCGLVTAHVEGKPQTAEKAAQLIVNSVLPR